MQNSPCGGTSPENPLGEFETVSTATDDSVQKDKADAFDRQSLPPIPGKIVDRNYQGEIKYIPGGQFEMGHILSHYWCDARTASVTMSAFWLSRTEVTVEEYTAYLENTGDPDPTRIQNFKFTRGSVNRRGDDYPVVALTHPEMAGFCEYYGGSLPTAAQIEHTTREGICHSLKDRAGHAYYPGNSVGDRLEKVCGDDDEMANDCGVCDLVGNAWETTSDTWHRCALDYVPAHVQDFSVPFTEDSAYYLVRGDGWSAYALNYVTAPAQDISFPFTEDSDLYEARGGSCSTWTNSPIYRDYRHLDKRYDDVGFRCTWSIEQRAVSSEPE